VQSRPHSAWLNNIWPQARAEELGAERDRVCVCVCENNKQKSKEEKYEKRPNVRRARRVVLPGRRDF
jgi:hypothetical protein